MSASRNPPAEGTAIQLYARIRPLAANDAASKQCFNVCKTSIDVTLPNHRSRSYMFDQTFMPDESQEMFYKQAIKQVVGEVLHGYNCTVFAYGQTGSGKTYTMVGPDVGFADKEQVGIIPRTFEDLWAQLDDESVLRVSYLEIYNEVLHDLLDDTSKVLKIYEDPKNKGAVRVHGLKAVTIKSPADFYAILRCGADKRRMAETLMNQHSSRSHTVFTLTVHVSERSSDMQSTVMKTGKLNLVDLAGSENVGRSGSQKERAREASNINRSLLTLGRVMKALVKHMAHVPFRQAKLTRILQDSLGGHTKTIMVATISTATCNLDETLSTLEYASHARHIITMPEVNSQMTVAVMQKKYADAISQLQKDTLANRTGDGVYLNEDNYREVLDMRTSLHNEAMVAIAECASYESQLAELYEMRTQLVEVFRVTHEVVINETLYNELMAATHRLRRDRRISDELIDVYERNEVAYMTHNRDLEAALDAHIYDHNQLRVKMTCFHESGGQQQNAVKVMLMAHSSGAQHVQKRMFQLEASTLGAKARQQHAVQEYMRSHRSFLDMMASVVSSKMAQMEQYVRAQKCNYVARSLSQQEPHIIDSGAGKQIFDAIVEMERVNLGCMDSLIADFKSVVVQQRKALAVQREVYKRHRKRIEMLTEHFQKEMNEVMISFKQVLRELLETPAQMSVPMHKIRSKLRATTEVTEELVAYIRGQLDEKLSIAVQGRWLLDKARYTFIALKKHVDEKADETMHNINVVTNRARRDFQVGVATAINQPQPFLDAMHRTVDECRCVYMDRHRQQLMYIDEKVGAMQLLNRDDDEIFKRAKDVQIEWKNELRRAEAHEAANGNPDKAVEEIRAMSSAEQAYVERAIVDVSELENAVREFAACCSCMQRAGDTPQRFQEHVTYTLPQKVKPKVLQMDEKSSNLPVLDENVEEFEEAVGITDNVY